MGAFCPDDPVFEQLRTFWVEKESRGWTSIRCLISLDFLPPVSFSTSAQPLRRADSSLTTLPPPLLTPSQGVLCSCCSSMGNLSWEKAISTPLAAPEREGCIMAGGVPAEISVWAMSPAQLFFPFDRREQRKCVPKGSHTTRARRRLLIGRTNKGDGQLTQAEMASVLGLPRQQCLRFRAVTFDSLNMSLCLCQRHSNTQSESKQGHFREAQGPVHI